MGMTETGGPALVKTGDACPTDDAGRMNPTPTSPPPLPCVVA
jgi:hypothetical protein